MKKLLLFFVLLSLSLSSFALGYRGFYDLSIGISTYSKSTVSNSNYTMEVKPFLGFVGSTSHGCQITPFLFAGAGFGLCYDLHDINYRNYKGKFSTYSVPIFLDFRWDLDVRKKVTPFFDVKIGYQIGFGKSSIEFNKNSNFDFYRNAAGSLGDIGGINSFYFQPTAGVRFRIKQNVGFNLGVTYLPNLKRELLLIDMPEYKFNNSLLMLNIGLDF